MKMISKWEACIKALAHQQVRCCRGGEGPVPAGSAGKALALGAPSWTSTARPMHSQTPPWWAQNTGRLWHLLQRLLSVSVNPRGYNALHINGCIPRGNKSMCAVLRAFYSMLLSAEWYWRECQTQHRGADIGMQSCDTSIGIKAFQYSQRHY